MNLTPSAREVLAAFDEVPDTQKLELLLEYANGLPDLPADYRDHPELLERVEECQSPVYLFTEVKPESVRIYLTAPEEAPTTRGFAAILQTSLDFASPETILNFDDSFIAELGVTRLVSPLRIRGMHGMLNRIKRQVREKLDAN